MNEHFFRPKKIFNIFRHIGDNKYKYSQLMVKYGYNFTFFDFKYNDIEFSLVDFYYIFRSSTLNHKNEISYHT